MYSKSICDLILVELHLVLQNLSLENKSHLLGLDGILLSGALVFKLLNGSVWSDFDLKLITTALSQYHLNLGIFH